MHFSDVQDLHNKYTGSLDLPQLSKREMKELCKKVSILTCTPNLAPTYLSNVLNLYTKGALESLSRQIQALTFPYNSLVLVRQTKLWTDSSLEKMLMVVGLVDAKIEAILQVSPGMRCVFISSFLNLVKKTDE